jgi:imidazoleglycerol-phosphate dehydratase
MKGTGIVMRTGTVNRSTKETTVKITLNLDGVGDVTVSTGIGFYDHMLTQLGKHGLFDLVIHTEGDLHIDSHHTIEDTAIALGEAFRQALGDKRGITRFADVTVPLDEARAHAIVDLSGRPYLVHDEPAGMAPMIGAYDTALTRHIFESFVANARICLHVEVLHGAIAHHVVEAQFKAVARALRAACALDPRITDVPSTKGTL